MPVIIVEMKDGRNTAQRQQLAEDLTSAFVKQGLDPDVVQVIFHENARTHWARGGKLTM